VLVLVVVYMARTRGFKSRHYEVPLYPGAPLNTRFMTSRRTGLLAPSVRRLDSVFGVPMLDGFARLRNTIFSACIGFSEDLYELDQDLLGDPDRVRAGLCGAATSSTGASERAVR
jgi:hypothetical protein